MNMAPRAWVRAFVWWALIAAISLIIIALHWLAVFSHGTAESGYLGLILGP